VNALMPPASFLRQKLLGVERLHIGFGRQGLHVDERAGKFGPWFAACAGTNGN
jgi:hypothetical protein